MRNNNKQIVAGKKHVTGRTRNNLTELCLPVIRMSNYLKKSFGYVGQTVQVGIVVHCIFEYIGNIVIVSLDENSPWDYPIIID